MDASRPKSERAGQIIVGLSACTRVLSGQFACSNSASTHCHAALQIPAMATAAAVLCALSGKHIHADPTTWNNRMEDGVLVKTSTILHPSAKAVPLTWLGDDLPQPTPMQKGGGWRRLCRRLATRRVRRAWRGGKGAVARAGRLSGHWPDPASSDPATPGLAGPGSPGRMPGPWRVKPEQPPPPATFL